MSNEKINIGFSGNDFFYNNISTINIDNAIWGIGTSQNNLCSLDEYELREEITKYFNDISFNVEKQPTTNLKQGQCSIKLVSQGTPQSDKNWQLIYSKDKNGNQICECKPASSVKNLSNGYQPYISYDNNYFELGSEPQSSSYYTCANSGDVTINDTGFRTINNDNLNKDKIIEKLVDYYLEICKNKKLALKLMEQENKNKNGDLQYTDSKNLYYREYLNRINLGIGIIFIFGTIGYSLFSNSIPKVIPNINPLPKPI